jgi:acetate---CoA ligase (ADP-forming)
MTATTTPPSNFDRRAIERLLKPRSVAIVGASAKTGALGASVIANLDRMQYHGEVYLINPNRDEIGGRRCLKSIDELPLGVDAAVLAIPRAAVLDTVRALARRQVGAAVIFSAGFAEGGEEGLEEQRELARIAAQSGMVIEGPNCLGLVNYVDGVALTFVETPAIELGERPGIGVVSQSGAMAAVLGVMLTSRELGISYSVSTGNEAASGVEDYVEYLLDDPKTKVIGMLVEQFRQPQRFIELARRARAGGKLIVLLHPGRSSAARESAATHTGAMAGDYQVMRVLVERAGVLVTENLEELSDVLELAARCPSLPSKGSVMITESGAFKALTLDTCEQVGLPLPILTDTSSAQLRAAMPEFVPVSNPLDLTAQGLVDPDLFRRTLAALLGDERFGSIVYGIILTDAKTAGLKLPTIIAAIAELQPQTPVIFAGLDEGAQIPEQYIQGLRELNVPYFASPDRVLRALAKLSAYAARDFVTCEDAVSPVLSAALTSGTVAEYRAKQFLAPLGISFPAGQFVVTLDEAISAAASIGFPVVVKAQAAALSHKSDAGGVILNLQNETELAEAWQQLHANIEKHCPGVALDGVLIEKMGQRGVEFIVGGRNDPQWGPVVLAGFGGVQAELMKDVRLLPPDLTVEGIIRELQLLKQSALLNGFRGTPALDVEALARIIANVATLLRAQSAIREIDLNPVIVYPQGEGAIALDALMLVAEE